MKERSCCHVRRAGLVISLAAIFTFWLPTQVFAQTYAGESTCGPLNAVQGDNRYISQKQRILVEHAHFPIHVEHLIRGHSGHLASDISYTLNAFPNHYRALISAVRYAEKSKTAVEEEKFLTDLANLRNAVNEQQTYADDDNTKADYADLEAAVVSMESKIAMVHELKNDLSTIEGTMTESSQNITSQIVALEVGRKTWEDETTVLHKDLSTKVVAEISRQQGDITATQEALKMVRYLVLL